MQRLGYGTQIPESIGIAPGPPVSPEHLPGVILDGAQVLPANLGRDKTPHKLEEDLYSRLGRLRLLPGWYRLQLPP